MPPPRAPRREHAREIVSSPDHRRRHTVRGEAEQAGLGAGRARCEARCVDPDDRDEPSSGEREHLGERARIRRRRHDHQLAARRPGVIAGEEPRETVERIRLRGCERAHGAVEVRRRRAHGNDGARAHLSRRAWRRARARRAPAASDPATRTAASKLESGGSPTAWRGIAVEDDDDTVVGRVLELLHHELAAARARRPVHTAQRLALLVLAHRVEVEAGGATQEYPASVPGGPTGIREEAVERGKTRSHDERRGIAQHAGRNGDEAEEIADDDPRIGELVDAAWQRSQRDSALRQAAVVPPHPARARAEPCRRSGERSSSRAAVRDRRRTPSATRTASPSVAGDGSNL